MQVAPTASRMRDTHGYTLICLLYMDMHGYTNIGKHTVKVCKHVKTSWDICKHHLYSNIIKYHQISSKFIISVQLDKGPEAQEVACSARFPSRILRPRGSLVVSWVSQFSNARAIDIYHHISSYIMICLLVLARTCCIFTYHWTQVNLIDSDCIHLKRAKQMKKQKCVLYNACFKSLQCITMPHLSFTLSTIAQSWRH